MKFDIRKKILSQSGYFKSRLDPVKGKWGGGRKLKSWKMLRVEGSG